VRDHKILTYRKTKNLLDIASEMGGLLTALKAAMLIMVAAFSHETVNSQYANRLYTWVKPASWQKPIKNDQNEFILDAKGKKTFKKSILESPIPLVRCLDFRKFCFCKRAS